MPGGGPQGTILGMFLFVVLINPVGFQSEVELGQHMTEGLNKRKVLKNTHLKCIDDLTVTESIHLKNILQVEYENLQYPLSFHERTGHCLKPEKSKVQEIVKEISEFASQNEMVINTEQTKVMLFNTSTKYNFFLISITQ